MNPEEHPTPNIEWPHESSFTSALDVRCWTFDVFPRFRGINARIFISGKSLTQEGQSAIVSGGVRLHPRAGANGVAVAVNVVDAAHGGPVLVFLEPGRGEGGLFARVRAIPVFGSNHVRGVRRIFQWIVLIVHLSGLDGHDFAVDGNHRVTEAVELRL